MKILLDAYFDNNFGDDLFFFILKERYAGAQFYIFWDKDNAEVLEKLEREQGVVVLPGECVMQRQLAFDGYVMLGGDVLPDGISYVRRISRMRHVKELGGFVAMLGFSLYGEYGEETTKDLQEMYSLADVVVIRDKFSAERFCRLVPGAEVVDCADMAFTVKEQKPATTGAIKKLLGMSVRKKLYSTDEEYANYCDAMARIADAYLEKYTDGKVRFLALSTGTYDDRVVAGDVIDRMQWKAATEIVAHTEDLQQFINSMAECTSMIATRFHALVFALKFRIPTVPVPYEVKVAQLLDEVGYQGERIVYGEQLLTEKIPAIIDGLEVHGFDEECASAYECKADKFFEKTDAWYEQMLHPTQTAQKKKGVSNLNCQVAAELTESTARIDFMEKQSVELNNWISALKTQRESFETQNAELENLRQAQQSELLELTGKVMQLEADKLQLEKQLEEMQKWVSLLQEERALFEKQNLEQAEEIARLNSSPLRKMSSKLRK